MKSFRAMSSSSTRAILLFCLGALGALGSGCTSTRLERMVTDIPMGESYVPDNLYSVDRLPEEVRRVAILPLFCEQLDRTDRERLDEQLRLQLLQAGRFELVSVSSVQLEHAIGVHQWSSQSVVPVELVQYLRDELRVDAVFQFDLTEYRPYRPYRVGVRARLFDLATGVKLWAVDEVLSSDQASVIVAARKYATKQAQQRYPYGDSYAALRGPMHFSRFVFSSLVQTLPPAAAR